MDNICEHSEIEIGEQHKNRHRNTEMFMLIKLGPMLFEVIESHNNVYWLNEALVMVFVMKKFKCAYFELKF